MNTDERKVADVNELVSKDSEMTPISSDDSDSDDSEDSESDSENDAAGAEKEVIEEVAPNLYRNKI